MIKKLITLMLIFLSVTGYTQELSYPQQQFISGGLLKNASFENGNQGWSLTGGGTPATSTTNLQHGAKSSTITTTGAWTRFQDVTDFATAKAGQDAEASIWVQTSSTIGDVWLCPRINGVSVTASVANGCMNYTNFGAPQKLTVFMLYGSTSTGLELKGASAITYFADNAYLGDRRPYALGITTTPWTPTIPTSPNASLGTLGTTECFYKREGGDLLERCKFPIGTPAASEARIALPTGLTSAGTSIIPTLSEAGTVTTSNSTATPVYFKLLIEPSVTYFTFGAKQTTDNQLAKITASSYFTTGNIVSFTARIPIAEWQGDNNAFTTKCDDLRQCETVFSASISNAGAISNQSTGSAYPWITTCTITNTSHFVCPFIAGAAFTVTPNCWVDIRSATAGTIIESHFMDFNNTSASQVAFDLYESGVRATNPVVIVCQKQGVDYTLAHMTQQIVQMRDQISTPGSSTGRPVTYSTWLSSTCVTSNVAGDWITSVADSSDTCTITVKTGKFAQPPSCTCSAPPGSGFTACTYDTSTATATNLVFRTGQGVTSSDTARVVVCHGVQ